MGFNDIDEIKSAGFAGFKKIEELFENKSSIPRIKGVYFVLNLGKEYPEFLQVGTGGYFKGKNPNVSIDVLKENWIDNTIVVYIGKAGGDDSDATLHSRLRQYLGFGEGKNVGHRGGRYIWQIKNNRELIVCWKALPTEAPRIIEANLIRQFYDKFSNRPFANLRD